MNGWQVVTKEILDILSNPAWSGISSLCSLIGIPLAIHLARRTPPPPQRYRVRKKERNHKIVQMVLFEGQTLEEAA